MKRLGIRSDTDEIIDYLLHGGDYALSAKLHEKLERMQECDRLIQQHISRALVIPLAMEKLAITQRQAESLYNDTILVYGRTRRSDRKYWVDIVLRDNTKHLKAASEAKDWNAVARLEKNRIEIITKLCGTGDQLDWSKVQPPSFVVFGFNPGDLGVTLPPDDELEEELKKLKRRKDKRYDGAEDVDTL